MNLQRYLEICLEIEQIAGAIYTGLAERFSFDQHLSAIWYHMARDEHDHAMQIKLAVTMAKERVIAGTRVAPERITELQARARQLKSELSAAQTGAVEALEAALALEAEFGHAHLLSSVEFERSDFKDLFRRLARSDEQHIQTLRAALAERKRPA